MLLLDSMAARLMLTQTRYFPYSRQSKKKSHRGAITARMLANLLSIAGVDHVITLDLHVSHKAICLLRWFRKCFIAWHGWSSYERDR